ncbi:MAG: FAD-binding oxidoreductase [Actinobacteria bacterium ATB1]|nr:FAD-binding oxidoreductase [Actinobacteria bacterium ATB1]
MSIVGVNDKQADPNVTDAERDERRAEVAAGLSRVVGARWVATDPAVLDTYTWQYTAEAITGSNWMQRPLAVAMPADTDEVAAIVRLCNTEGIQFKAISTGFGAWGAATEPDRVVLLDLRRMNRILEVDAKNMYAVVEPYVTANQLQVEVLPHGLNTHVAGCGAQHSVLASATSVMGQGWDGVSMGFSGRNLLAVEWVTPEGEIVRSGSVDASGEWFSGDGPGPSMRGIFRGYAGAFSGLGVFTKAAVKLYPWAGPGHLEVTGSNPDYMATIPEHHVAAVCVVDGWDQMAELGYRVADAEIATFMSRNAPSLMSGVLTADNNTFADLYGVPLFHEMLYALVIVITAESAEERDLKVDMLKAILSDLGGGMLANLGGPEEVRWLMRAVRVLARRIGPGDLIRSVPGAVRMLVRDARRFGLGRLSEYLPSFMYMATVTSGLNIRGVFRFGGTFWTAMGSLVSWDNAIHGAKVGAQVKRKYIDKGVIFDDGADNAWGGFYEGGTYAHLEELACYDPTDKDAADAVFEYVFETNLVSIEHHTGLPINAVGPANSALFGPHCSSYDTWQDRIKASFDPHNTADGSFYVEPDFTPNERMVAGAENVTSDRAPIDPNAPDL